MGNKTTLRERLGDEGIAAFKGLLILIVVLDHNNEAHAFMPDVMRPLTFHVLGFLLLPFLMRSAPLSRGFVVDRLIRYGVPQAAIITLAAALYWVLYERGAPLMQVARDYVAALAIGSAPLVKRSTGFLAYWFLPTLFGTVVALAVYRALSTGQRAVAIVALALCHCFLNDRSFPEYPWVPFGLAIVANVFVLGLVVERVARSRTAYALRWAIPVVLAGAYGALVVGRAWLEVATLTLAPITNPVLFVEQDAAGVSGVLCVLVLAVALSKQRTLMSVGQYSLMIYLLHPLAYAGWGMMLRAAGLDAELSLVNGVLSYLFALAVSWGAAAAMARSSAFRAWITPRGRSDWGLLASLRAVRAWCKNVSGASRRAD